MWIKLNQIPFSLKISTNKNPVTSMIKVTG
jgi:hypothetical protein